MPRYFWHFLPIVPARLTRMGPFIWGATMLSLQQAEGRIMEEMNTEEWLAKSAKEAKQCIARALVQPEYRIVFATLDLAGDGEKWKDGGDGTGLAFFEDYAILRAFILRTSTDKRNNAVLLWFVASAGLFFLLLPSIKRQVSFCIVFALLLKIRAFGRDFCPFCPVCLFSCWLELTCLLFFFSSFVNICHLIVPRISRSYMKLQA